MTGPLFAGCDQVPARLRKQVEISIHAPLAGCDHLLAALPTHLSDFNPRTPCGVRPIWSSATSRACHFNPRTPCGVRPVYLDFGLEDINISIHAPLAGCDVKHRRAVSVAHDFNPRTPCGVRPELVRRHIDVAKFQSTHPLRGATSRQEPARPRPQFQSTHPLRGATAKLPKYSRQICAKATKFLQSRTKSGVAACWAKGKRPLFPALRGANLPGKTGTLPVRIR